MIETLSARSAVAVFGALAHEARLKILCMLVRVGPDGLTAGELSRRIGLSATAASFHFNLMRHAGLVQRRRVGSHLMYSVVFTLVHELRNFLDAECCADTHTGCCPHCPGPAKTGHSASPAAPSLAEQQASS